MSPRASAADVAYAILLHVYPRAFRRRFEAEMLDLLRARHAAIIRPGARLTLWIRTVIDVVRSAWRVRRDSGRSTAPATPSPFSSDHLRDGWRQLRRRPAVSAAVIFLMALTIGSATSVFAVVNASLLQPLPFRDSERLVALWEYRPDRGLLRNTISGHEFPEWQRRSRAFEAMAAFHFAGADFTLTGSGEPAPLSGVHVSANFFDVLGVTPALGRTFRPEEDTPGRGDVVILSDHVWRSRLAADAGVIGRPITLNDRPYTVIGIAPSGFRSPGGPRDRPADLWTPIAEPIHLMVGRHYLFAIGRLKAGVSLEAARADLASVARAVADAYPNDNRNHLSTAFPLRNELTREHSTTLWLIFAAVLSLLLIGCTNMASLLIAQGLARAQELRVRLALGASRSRIAIQLLTEHLLLTGTGGAIGVVGAVAVTRTLPAAIPAGILPDAALTIDVRVLAFALVLSIATGLVFGIAPALQVSRLHLSDAMKQQGRTIAGGQSKARGLLVAAQIALTLVLVAAALLTLESLLRIRLVEPGFRTGAIVSADIALPTSRYGDPARQRAFFSSMIERLSATHGINNVAVVNLLPLAGSRSTVAVQLDGSPPPASAEDLIANFRVVSTRYFQTMGIPLRTGREFSAGDARRSLPLIRYFPRQPIPPFFNDAQAAPVAIVNEAMAWRVWPGQSPIGKRFRVIFSPVVTVVGVVADTRNDAIREAPRPEFYLSDLQEPLAHMNVIVDAGGDAAMAADLLRGALRAEDPSIPARRIDSMARLISDAAGVPRLASMLLGAFASVAVLLMVAGVYSLVTLTASLRRHEFAVRLALGATPSALAGRMIRQSLMLAGLGTLGGAAGILGLSRALRTILFEVRPMEPSILFVVLLLIVAVVLCASVIPARRLRSLDPTTLFLQG